MTGNSRRVLVACEESQAVTTRLRALGLQAFSCDILPTSGDHPEWHMQEDVAGPLLYQWDMIIAFPPCTDLAVSGAAWFEQKRKDGRQQRSIDFFMQFTKTTCPLVAIENPVGIMNTYYRKPDQIVQPFWFGDRIQKKTCLWLKGLPCLEPTNVVEANDYYYHKSGKRMPMWYYETSLLPHKDRAKARSKTFAGLADAMAKQWGSILLNG